jgi:hypothetical protein
MVICCCGANRSLTDDERLVPHVLTWQATEREESVDPTKPTTSSNWIKPPPTWIETQKPQNQKNNENCPKHVTLLCSFVSDAMRVGWHWEFLPAFASELVPGVDLVPF